MPAAFRRNHDVTRCELQRLGFILHDEVELRRTRDDVYQLVPGRMALPTGIAIEAAEISVGILEITYAERAGGFEYLVFRRVQAAFAMGLMCPVSSLISMMSTMIHILQSNLELDHTIGWSCSTSSICSRGHAIFYRDRVAFRLNARPGFDLVDQIESTD